MSAVETAFLTPLLLHAGLVLALYVALTLARAAAVRQGQAAYNDFARADGDPPAAARVARNLGNQFEAPLLAYFAALFLLWRGAVAELDVVLAWAFLIGRVIHTLVQTRTDNVRLRGYVFAINFLAVIGLVAHVAWVVWAPMVAR